MSTTAVCRALRFAPETDLINSDAACPEGRMYSVMHRLVKRVSRKPEHVCVPLLTL